MSQNVNVNLVPGNYPKEFHVSQYDVGRQLIASIVDSTGAYSIPSGATVTLVGTKPSGFGFTLSGSVGSGGVVTFSTTATVTAEYGRIPCELRITSGSTILGTANCMLIVEESPHPEGTTDGDGEQIIPELTLLVERVEAAASSVLDMQVEADTLPAGSSATYSYDEETNTATFGIPQGEAGAGAAGVVASAYSASSTYAVGDYVIHDSNLYRCTTAIATAEAFTAAHWTQVVLGDDVSDLKSESSSLLNRIVQDETVELFRYNAFDGEYKQGLYLNSDGSYNPSRNDYICISNKIPVADVDVIRITDIPSNVTEIYFTFYSSDDSYLGNFGGLVSGYLEQGSIYLTKQSARIRSNAASMGISLKDANGISPKNTKSITVYVEHIGLNTLDVIKTSIANSGKYFINWQNYIYFYGMGYCEKSMNRIGFVKPIKITESSVLSVDDGYSMSIQWFSDLVVSRDNERGSTGWRTGQYTVSKGDIITVNLKRNNESNIYPNEGSAFKIMPLYGVYGVDYAVDQSFGKRGVSMQHIGTLTYLQAFCKYDDKYYSTDGSHISVQDSAFAEINSADLSLGHGNSMQLGTAYPSHAYISGWNDSTVYVVDLATLTIVNTISLPSGYDLTTVAIDDVNEYAYIFAGTTASSSSEVYYNFVVYDYGNRQIISTKKLTHKFGAMQACDFIDGKIIALNGLGTAALPNGYRVYNTNGDMIAEYVLGTFNTSEPEGVFVDRNTKDVYMSFAAKELYKIDL